VVLNPSLIPTDVTFVIEHCGSEVKAHKFILAMSSPVFLNQFFGPLKETREIIPVKETAKEPFARMVDFLYGKEVDWKAMSVEEMFDIANMAEKYHIEALMEAVKKAIEDYPLDETNVVASASLAQEYDQFEEVSNVLLLQCAKFLKTVLLKAKDFEAFAAKYCDTDLSESAFKLLGIMSTVPPASCCTSETCRRGKGIYSKEDCNVGDRVKFSPVAKDKDVTEEQRKNGSEGIITGMSENSVTVKLDDGICSDVDYFYFELDGFPTFLFSQC